MVNPMTEFVSLTERGVWQVLWESLRGETCPAQGSERLPLGELFSGSVEIGLELERTFGRPIQAIGLVEPQVLTDEASSQVWIRFSVSKDDLKSFRLSRPRLLQLIADANFQYIEVLSDNCDLWTFELARPKRWAGRSREEPFDVIGAEIRALNPFVFIHLDDVVYYLPIQARLPFAIPQLMVSYTIMFWLGSLVRYDPHSVADLRESKYWILIDGFVNQSRAWLLELFEWELYHKITHLRTVR